MSIDQLIERIRKTREETGATACIFDADHTLWFGDLGDDAFQLALNRRSFKPEAGPALDAILIRSGAEPMDDPHRAAVELFERYKNDALEEIDIVATMVVCFCGWTPDEVRELGREVMERGLAKRIHEGVEALIEATDGNAYVVSGSPHWMVEAAVERWGIPADRVEGARAVLDAGKLGATMKDPVPYKEGKRDVLKAHLASKRALAAFGDSLSDLCILEDAIIPVAVNPRPGLRKALDAARPGEWEAYMPTKTVGGHAVHAHTIDRIIV